ncbi:sensor histidine kinase [Amycolatopsis sp.]|uniref:sensor histidine kinase n=1 Tax=Amycolatopsis sp. TaxID=37632 RepID=UPI002D80AB82|nr:sensor histidine kinase [Amycolatopsis sp.]HET6704179.1 sensor histidine kinase [Amycolatopsis sp.]
MAAEVSGVRRRGGTDLLLHAVFFLIVVGSAVRLLSLDAPLCPYLVTLSALLAAGYAAGLRRWPSLTRWRPLWIGALLAMWLALVVLSPGGLKLAVAWCAVPLACVTVRALPPKASFVALVAITAVVAFAAARPVFDPVGVLVPVLAVWGAAMFCRRQQRDAETQRRLLDDLRRTRGELATRQREAGALAERARIARELHDSLTQELAASRTLLQAADRDWPRAPERARETVRTVERYLGDNLVEARRMIADLTPPALDDDDLPAALAALCARARESGTAGEVRFVAGNAPRPLPPPVTAALLRVVQGALANVRDHARAGRVTVSLAQHDGEVAVVVRDDGAGFTPGRTTAAPQRGFGLDTMRDRLREHDGELVVDSAPGRGTVLTARIPLPVAVG